MLTKALEDLFSAAILACRDTKERETLETLKQGEDSISLPEALTEEEDDDISEKQLFAIIGDLSIPEKIKLALYGNKIARTLLIKDTNKQIPLFVLSNPGITEAEILEISKNTGLEEGVFRGISRNAQWMKGYAIKMTLVSNPKVPQDVSLKWLKHLQTKDLRRLGRSKNVPSVIASQARKLVERRSN